MDVPNMLETAKPVLIAFGLKVLGAIALYIIGRWLIGHRVVTSTMNARRPLYAWRRSLYRELLKARRWLDGPA